MVTNLKRTNKGIEVERYNTFYSTSLKREMVDYEYVYLDGSHFKSTADTLDEARDRRDKWYEKKEEKLTYFN